MKILVEHAVPIRDARYIAHLINICREERRTVLSHFTENEERSYLENMGLREAVFVARVEEQFAGFAGIAPRWGYSDRLKHCGEGGTWVMPVWRGKGVGTSLWREGIIPWCKKVGFKHIGFFVMAHNKGAIAFYESLGFRVCGSHRRLVHWNGEYLDAIEMERWLES